MTTILFLPFLLFIIVRYHFFIFCYYHAFHILYISVSYHCIIKYRRPFLILQIGGQFLVLFPFLPLCLLILCLMSYDNLPFIPLVFYFCLQLPVFNYQLHVAVFYCCCALFLLVYLSCYRLLMKFLKALMLILRLTLQCGANINEKNENF